MLNPREEMIALQKRWAKDLKRRIYSTEERRDPALDEYYAEYREQFQAGFERPATRDELARQLSQSDIAYFGDFHTLKIAQKTILTLLGDTVEGYGREVILGMEMVHVRHQRYVDEYISGRIVGDEEFLRAIEYEKTWGFPWAHYRGLFEFCRLHGFKVLALNTHPGDGRTLRIRDSAASRLVAAASAAHPDKLVAVVFGDLHVGETHLPADVRRELSMHEIARRDMIVYQNSETFYWRLVEQHKEHVVDAVKIKRGVYCVMAATPLVKFQSWINWQETGGELEYAGIVGAAHSGLAPSDLADQFNNVVGAIAKFLGINEEGLDNFEVYSSGDLDFMDDLKRSKQYTAAELKHFETIIAERRSAFFSRARTVYLGSLSMNDAASMACQFIRYVCAPEQFEETQTAKDAFYSSVLDEALSTLGVLILNPRYRVPQPSDIELRLKEYKGKRLDGDRRLERDSFEHVLAHERMVVRFIEADWAGNTLRTIYKLSPELFRRVTRLLGAQLGSRLHEQVYSGRIEVGVIRHLFYDDRGPGEPWETYVNLRRMLMLLPDLSRPMKGSL